MPMSFVGEMHKVITEAGSGDWIDVYANYRNGTDRLATHAILVPNSRVTDVLSTESWGHNSPDRLGPGCTKYNDGSIQYHRFGNDEGYEAIVIYREFHGIKPSYLDISEEFKLFHNLYYDKKNEKYFKVRDDGTEIEVIRQSEDRISIRAVEIKQFLAIKEMHLALLFDLYRKFPKPVTDFNLPETSGKANGSDFTYLYTMGDAMFKKNGSVVRVLGKLVIKGYSKEDSDFWPYNDTEEDEPTYMEFVYDIDEKGREIGLPCKPYGDRYLTPIYFRPEVLNKYYDNPTKYSVEDGLLRCGALWSVQLDNDSSQYVCVFLGDIGRDIPLREHGYWRSFNIPPAGPMSETAFRRSFMAEFASPQRKDLLFKQELAIFNQAWRERHQWDFFKPLSEADQHCLTSLRIPATDEQNEFDTQVMYLTKLIVDSLNEAEIARETTTAPDQKGISKLEEYLKTKGVPDYSKSIEFLRNLQSLRSTGAAHRKGSNYEKAAKKLGLDDLDLRVVYQDLLSRAIEFLVALKVI
jgi:hypothetical protein